MDHPPYSPNGRPSDPARQGTIAIPYVDADPESEEYIAGKSAWTQNPPLDSVRPDAGYLLKGWRRVLVGKGKDAKWCYTNSKEDDPKQVLRETPPGPDVEYVPQDLYKDKETFPDSSTTVQVVEFRKETPVPAKWLPPMTDPEEVTRVLGQRPEFADGWRWVHCEGLHGDTLKAVANTTGWNERKFGGIFTWTRASMEWADNVILVHFKNQGTRIFIWQGGGKYPVFITCSTLNPGDSSVTRILDFVDRGCSRPEIVLRTDPTLMFYGIVRAVIQDLRFSVHHVGNTMKDAFNRGISQPSQSNLAFFYHLQDRLFILSLDATSLKNAAINLVKVADKMQEVDEERKQRGERPDPKRLISERTRFMLNDQMGLINLLSQELPDVSQRTEAIVNLAFNTLAFRTNNLLQILAVITLASLPLTVVTGILGIQWFDDTRINGEQIAIVLATVGGAVLIGLIWFGWWFVQQYRDHGNDDGSHLDEQSKRKQTDSIGVQPHHQHNNAHARHVWAKAQDLERDNRLVVERAAHDPMMKQFHPAHSPRSTIYHPPISIDAQASVKRRPTSKIFTEGGRHRPTRSLTSAPARSPEAIAEEGRNSPLHTRQQTSPVTSFRSLTSPSSHESH